MNEDSSPPQKRFFATSAEKLKEFHSDCVAVATAGSEIFLLLGNEHADGPQSFIIARILTKDKKQLEEYHDSFDATWRCSALIRFKTFADALPGGYSNIGFLEISRDTASQQYSSPRFGVGYR